MKWTFGIITDGNAEENIRKIHKSILNQNIDDDFEIIVVGGRNLNLKNMLHVPFDETIKRAWITKKKNIISQLSKYDNICMMHDYVILFNGWYENYKNFDQEWDVCMNPVINQDSQRFRDWITWPEWCDEGRLIFLDYNTKDRTKQMYISGTYFCVKKVFMLNNPLDESLSWGQGEDVEWCGRIRDKWIYKCNNNSEVGLLKNKQNDHWYDSTNTSMRESWDKQKYLEIWRNVND
jgi:hypothetical protein